MGIGTTLYAVILPASWTNGTHTSSWKALTTLSDRIAPRVVCTVKKWNGSVSRGSYPRFFSRAYVSLINFHGRSMVCAGNTWPVAAAPSICSMVLMHRNVCFQVSSNSSSASHVSLFRNTASEKYCTAFFSNATELKSGKIWSFAV